MNRSLLEEKWNNSGGSIDKDRLFRNTKRTCYNSKKWNKIKIAQPNRMLSKKEIVAKLSHDDTYVFAKYKEQFVEAKLATNWEMPLENEDDYCVSTFSVVLNIVYTNLHTV